MDLFPIPDSCYVFSQSKTNSFVLCFILGYIKEYQTDKIFILVHMFFFETFQKCQYNYIEITASRFYWPMHKVPVISYYVLILQTQMNLIVW